MKFHVRFTLMGGCNHALLGMRDASTHTDRTLIRKSIRQSAECVEATKALCPAAWNLQPLNELARLFCLHVKAETCKKRHRSRKNSP